MVGLQIRDALYGISSCILHKHCFGPGLPAQTLHSTTGSGPYSGNDLAVPPSFDTPPGVDNITGIKTCAALSSCKCGRWILPYQIVTLFAALLDADNANTPFTYLTMRLQQVRNLNKSALP